MRCIGEHDSGTGGMGSRSSTSWSPICKKGAAIDDVGASKKSSHTIFLHKGTTKPCTFATEDSGVGPAESDGLRID
jgi:hypothetical protein